MEKTDEIKGKTLYSSNGIKLVGADSGYCYIIDDESEDGLCLKLKELTSKNVDELIEMGKKGKDFVLNKKNNQAQVERIINFIKE